MPQLSKPNCQQLTTPSTNTSLWYKTCTQTGSCCVEIFLTITVAYGWVILILLLTKLRKNIFQLTNTSWPPPIAPMDSALSKSLLEPTKSGIHLRRDILRPPPMTLLSTPNGIPTTWLTIWPSSKSTRLNSTVINSFYSLE